MSEFTGDEEWHVQVGPSDLKVMSVEQIEDALRLGIIHERTNVWTEGMDGWASLADALGDLGTEEVEDVEEIVEPEEPRTRPRPSASPAFAPAPLVASPSRPAPLVASQPTRSAPAPAPLVSQPPAGSFAPAPLVAAPVSAAAPEVEVEEEDDEIWHVQISPSEVKVMTVDQLDDAFRLDIINGDTRVWTESLGVWLPLREVAGLDEEEEEQPAQAVTSEPPGPAPLVATASRPPGPAPLVATSRPPGPAPLVATTSRPPGPAPLVQTGAPPSLNSMPPLAIEVPSPRPQKHPNQTMARVIMWSAAVAACFVGLHRNGGSYAAASAAGKVDAYHAAMSRIGGSSASTPVGIRMMIDDAKQTYRLDQLSETQPVGSNAPKSTLPEPQQEEEDEEEVEAKPSKSAAPAARRSSSGSSSGAQRAASQPAPFSGGGKKSGKKARKSDHYDPLNAELP